MSLPPREQHHLEMLLGACVDEQYVKDYYGIEGIFSNRDLINDVGKFGSTYNRPVKCAVPMADRYLLEEFLLKRRLLSKRWFAAKLGLQEDMLNRVLGELHNLPVPIRGDHVFYGCLVSEQLEDELIASLRTIRFRTFGDRESYCLRLQKDLCEALAISENEMEQARLWCSTNEEMGQFPRRFASFFDCLTCQPLSVRHQMWLNFQKPLNLGADRCSKLFYARHRGDLDKFVAGSDPQDLDEYLDFAENRAKVP